MRFIILLFFIGFSLTFSQNITTDVNKDFEQGLQLYKAKNYDVALSVFKRVMSADQPNTKVTASAFFISKIYLQTKKYDQLESFCNNFLTNFPNSKYINDIRTNLLQGLIEQNEYEKAFEQSLKFIQKSKSISFSTDTKTVAEQIALGYLSSTDVKNQIEIYQNSELESFLLLLAGKISLSEGDYKSAIKYFDRIINEYTKSDEYTAALTLKRSSFDTNSTNVSLVAILMSLTDQNGRSIESVKAILEGMKFAFHENNFEKNDKIGLLISDLERDDQKIESEVNKVKENSAVKCILGPVFSDDVKKVLSDLGETNICVLSPTATDNDLVSLSNNFYQANPSFEARGKTFAQYLYYVENRKKLAILNSIEGYSPLLAASFAKEFERLGGKIVIKETYKSDSQTLSEQMSRIATFSSELEGIYAPISDRNDATIILSQMVQKGLSTRIYGNQDWFIAKGFETSPELSNNLIFESDYFIDYNDPDFRDFASQFKQQTGIEANRNVLYGYDLAKYIITVMQNTGSSRQDIKSKIESGINVNGYHNNISFDSERTNKYINIVRFKDGIFELIDKFRSGN